MGAGASSTKLPRAPLKDFALLKPRNYHGIKVTEGYDDEVDREDEVPPPPSPCQSCQIVSRGSLAA